MPFVERDIPGFQGQLIEVWVYDPETNQKKQLRGAQNFNTSEEKSETRVSEMGFDATKVIYGTAAYSVSCSMLVRDLVQIARLCGLNPDTADRINVNEFKKVNIVCWYKNPENTSEIIQTKYAGGFKARTSSTSQAVDANTTVTIEGGADYCASFEGKAEVYEVTGLTQDQIDSGITIENVAENGVWLVECPAGKAMDSANYNVSYDTVNNTATITFNEPKPRPGWVLRVVYKPAS